MFIKTLKTKVSGLTDKAINVNLIHVTKIKKKKNWNNFILKVKSGIL